MLLLTKFDKKKLILSVDTIKYIESIPDTLITFINGDSVLVKESLDEIIEQSLTQRAKILQRAEALKTHNPA